MLLLMEEIELGLLLEHLLFDTKIPEVEIGVIQEKWLSRSFVGKLRIVENLQDLLQYFSLVGTHPTQAIYLGDNLVLLTDSWAII